MALRYSVAVCKNWVSVGPNVYRVWNRGTAQTRFRNFRYQRHADRFMRFYNRTPATRDLPAGNAGTDAP